MRQEVAAYLQQAVCVRRQERKIEKKKTKKCAPPKTRHEIHSRPATATNSRRRATKHVARGSPYSRGSSIDPGFVKISLACIHTYPHCCFATLVFVLVHYFLAIAASSCFLYCDARYVCISGYGVARWCMTLD